MWLLARTDVDVRRGSATSDVRERSDSSERSARSERAKFESILAGGSHEAVVKKYVDPIRHMHINMIILI